jgi:hypothetical protein
MWNTRRFAGLAGATVLAVGMCVALPGSASAVGVGCVDSGGTPTGPTNMTLTSDLVNHRVSVVLVMAPGVAVAPNSLLTTVRADYLNGGTWVTNGIEYVEAKNLPTTALGPLKLGPLGQPAATLKTSGTAGFVGNSMTPSNTNWHIRVDMVGGGTWLYCRVDTNTTWTV